MYEATLFKFGKWIDYGSNDPRRKKFPSKTAWSASCNQFRYEGMPFYRTSAHHWYSNSVHLSV